jgi:ATP-dependent Clp protease adaptor protein ClpS
VAQKKKTKKGDSGAGVDLLDKQKSKNKVEPPKKYKVVYHNDDYTPMDLVAFSLIEIFHLNALAAFNIMMLVHEKGKGIAQGGLSREIAETKANRVVQFFRENGHPLLATFEPEE